MEAIDPRRAPARYATALAAVIALGLTSRWPGLLPWPVAKWSGSILWAAMIYLLVSLAAPRAARATRLGIALAVAFALELSRLYSVPWLDAFRRSTVGMLALGRIFSPWNLLAYALGIGAAASTLRPIASADRYGKTCHDRLTAGLTLMARRAGSADLPLHGGRVPPWLGERMTRLGAVISQAIVHHYGREELLRRLAHPFWFQSFGAVMGMDWHSSGITTSVIGALKRGLAPLEGELGIHVCGGRGRHSRETPGQLVAIGQRKGFDGDALATASRLVAKVDSAAVQDGFDLYLHGFIVTDDGQWVVVQQGMNGERRQARRYHWLSEGLTSFVEEPHAAIDGPQQGVIVNLTDRRAEASRRGQLDLLATLGPDRIAREFAALQAPSPAAPAEAEAGQLSLLPHLVMPAHHDVRAKDVIARRLHGNLAAAADSGPRDFAALLLTPKVGARTVQALAMVAEVVHGAPYRFSDPARFSLAHGGKDRHPYAVPLKVYDQTIAVLKSAVQNARLGRDEALGALKRLDDQARLLERTATGPSLPDLTAQERFASPDYGGRSVFGWEQPVHAPAQGKGPRRSSR